MASKFLDKGLTPVLLICLIGFVAYWGQQADASRSQFGDRLLELEKWKAATAADRWTAQDQLRYVEAERNRESALWQAFLASIEKIAEEVKRHETQDHPPKWFSEKVAELQDRVQRHDDVLGQICEKLARIESAVVPKGLDQ